MVYSVREAMEVGQALLSAPFDDAGWDGALLKMAHFTASAHGELIGFSHSNAVKFNWTTAATPQFFSEFVEMGGGDPAVNWRVACSGAPFEIKSEADYASIRNRRAGQYAAYDEFADRWDMMHGCQTVLLSDKATFIGLAVLRSGTDGPTTSDDREAFAAIAPYALSAARLQQALEHQGALMIAGALEQMKAAAIICDGDGRVCGLTMAAEDWLSRSSRLTLRDGRLAAARADENKRLGQAVKHGLNGGAEQGLVDRFWLKGTAGHLDSEICEVFALPRRPWSFGFDPRLLIIIRSPTGVAGDGRELVKEMWDLSSAECAVAMLLAQGHSRGQIALSRGTSAVTVQTQLRSLFRKCGVSREAELVALLRTVIR